jgi:hypothetical protein
VEYLLELKNLLRGEVDFSFSTFSFSFSFSLPLLLSSGGDPDTAYWLKGTACRTPGNVDDPVGVGTGTGKGGGFWNDFCRRGNPGNRVDPPLPALLPPIQLKDDCDDTDDAPDAGVSRIRDWDCALRRSRWGDMPLLPVLVCVEGSTTVVDAMEGGSAEALGTIPDGRLFVLPLCVEEVSRRANPEISSSRGCPFEDLVMSG